MVIPAELFWLGLLWLFGRGRESEPREFAPIMPASLPPARGVPTSAPWPQVVPSGLPPFPGSAWQYDEPPPAAVVQRAGQLVSQLWQGGAGTFRVEQTGGRWIAFRAEVMRSGKKGVAAYRQKTGANAPARLPGASAQSAQLPAAPAAPAAPVASRSAPAAAAAPVKVSLPANSRLLPTLRRGAGIKPQAPNDDVRLMQRQLGIKQDGQFGSGTETALRAFQTAQVTRKRAGWTMADVDGACGPKTWTALLEAKA